MIHTKPAISFWLPGILSMILTFVGSGPARAQVQAPRPEEQPRSEEPGRQFRFERAPWRSVLEWLAEWADLELHVDTLPTGSFTYSGKEFYTADEAMNRINLFLIPQRYSLVRSGNLLSVISLDDQRSIRQLDAMAVTVRVDELQDLGSHELVKCLMPLRDVQSNRVLQELSGLMLIRQPVVLPNTNQLLVTDTAGKLRMVQEIITSMDNPNPLFGPVKRFPLGNLDPERVLTQIRPHVGLDPLETIGGDIRLSVDPIGNQLLASGSNENLDAIAGVLEMLEQTSATPVALEPHTFRPHDLGEADMQTVVKVLHTLLADQDVRMSPDARSNQIAIMGPERTHDLVDDTIRELTGSNAVEFHAIAVRSVDPRYAAAVLNDMFAQPSGEQGQPGMPSAASPKIEADVLHNRLFVRARPADLAAIERALAELGESDAVQSSGLRLLPYRGERGRLLLETAHEFWPHDDELLILPSSDDELDYSLEREINPETWRHDKQPSRDASDRAEQRDQTVKVSHVAISNETRQDQPGQSRIRVQLTPRGLLIHSDDPDALKRFEEHARLIAGPAGVQQLRHAVFYLKHAHVDAANLLLQRVLDAEAYATALTSSSSYLSGALGSYEVDASSFGNLWTAGTVTVIPDSRLNRLFAYGTTEDLLQIEKHLEVIDRESSLAPVKTHGTPLLIPLEHARADDVAEILRDTYAGLIAASAKEVRAVEQAQQQRQNQNQQGNRQNQGQNGDQRTPQQPQRGGSDSRQQLIKLAFDAPSNTLIVTAPSQLAAEIEQLANTIDKQSAQSVSLIPIRASSAPRIHDTLKNLYGDRIRSSAPEKDGRPQQ